jgi:outer membrane protein
MSLTKEMKGGRFIVGLMVSVFIMQGFLIVMFFWTKQDLRYVDSAKLVNEFKGMEAARKIYQEKAGAWKANIDTLSGEVQNEIMNYEKASKSLSAKERQLSEELIRQKQKQLYEYQQAIAQQAKEEDDKMTQEVLSQINAYIKKYGAEKGYKIVLGAANGNIVYADEGLDITSEILEGLNRDYAGQ